MCLPARKAVQAPLRYQQIYLKMGPFLIRVVGCVFEQNRMRILNDFILNNA